MKLLPHKHGIQKRSATLSYSIITTTGLSSSLTFFKAATSAGILACRCCDRFWRNCRTLFCPAEERYHRILSQNYLCTGLQCGYSCLHDGEEICI